MRGNRRISKFDRAEYLDFDSGERKKIKVPYAKLHFDDLYADYKNLFRIQYWKNQGMSPRQVAHIIHLDVSEVREYWDTHPSTVKPHSRFQRKVKLYELNLLKMNFEPFKPVQLIRNFAPKSGLYNILRREINWEPAMTRRFNRVTKEVTYHDMSAQGRMVSGFDSLRSGIEKLDSILESVQASLEIADPTARLLLNKYSSGRAKIGEHEHDFWSAILSFGASRVMFIEKQPVVLHDGDLLVLGTHRHGIPKQPKIQQGRISVAIFYRPEKTLEIDQGIISRRRTQKSNVAPRIVRPPASKLELNDEFKALRAASKSNSASAKKNHASKADDIDQVFSDTMNEDEQLALALYLSQIENSI